MDHTCLFERGIQLLTKKQMAGRLHGEKRPPHTQHGRLPFFICYLCGWGGNAAGTERKLPIVYGATFHP
ncbi:MULTISPECIES: hypothetical protein [unclassified Pseudomonas]|uniref:hypothetical protein n=1 Tax=unclassified Pseudomonas TaxID=196821 RepID=UPI0023B91157|nr:MULTISPECIES: hypothetical protein [unclassified Pseudomonas]